MERILYDDSEYNDMEELTDAWDLFSYDLKHAINDSKDVYFISGTFGRWDGPVLGGRIVETYDDLIQFLSFRGEHYDVFKDVDGEFHIDQSHHDGSNHYVLRRLTKKGLIRYRNHMRNVGEIDAELRRSLYKVEAYTCKARLAKKMGYI